MKIWDQKSSVEKNRTQWYPQGTSLTKILTGDSLNINVSETQKNSDKPSVI